MTPRAELEAFVAAADAEARARGGKELGEAVRALMSNLCDDGHPASTAAADAIVSIVQRRHLSHLERARRIVPILQSYAASFPTEH
jgi:hypothetical protein